ALKLWRRVKNQSPRRARRVESSKPKNRSIRQLPSSCRSRKATYRPNSVMRTPLESRQDCSNAPNSVAWSGATRRVETASRRSMSFREAQLLRSEEHTSELQSPYDLECRLLLEEKK